MGRKFESRAVKNDRGSSRVRRGSGSGGLAPKKRDSQRSGKFPGVEMDGRFRNLPVPLRMDFFSFRTDFRR
jgi:hypothetical protein